MRVFRASRVFTGSEFVDEGAVAVGDDGKILAAGPAADVSSGGAPVEAWQGTLLPGLIDAHVHLCLSGGPDPRSELEEAHPVAVAASATQALRSHLAAGVTTVRDLGGPGGIAIELGRLVAAGRLPGPRVIAAGEMLCITGGHGAFMGREVDGPWEVRRAVREQFRAGAGCIKVVATGGMMTPGVDPGAPQMTFEEMAAAVEEAARAGHRVAAHAQGTEGIYEALRAGVHTIEHGIWLDDRVIRLLLQRKAFLVPTFSASRGILEGRGRGVPDFVVEKMARAAEDHVSGFAAAVEAGVAVAAGTDAGTPMNPHGNVAGEVAEMISHGLPVHDALRACTSAAADALGRSDLGRLAEGCVADLVLVEGDPERDPQALRNVRRVVQGGRILDPEVIAV